MCVLQVSWENLTQGQADAVAGWVTSLQESKQAYLQDLLGFARHPATSASAAIAAFQEAEKVAAHVARLEGIKARLAADEHAVEAAPAELADLQLAAVLAGDEPAATTAMAGGAFTDAQRSAPFEQWLAPTAVCMAALQYRQAKSACDDAVLNLNIKEVKLVHAFRKFNPPVAGRPQLSGTQDTYQTLELPSGEAALPMREDVSFGHIHTFKDEASGAQVEADLVAVRDEGGEQRVQLKLHGTMPGVRSKNGKHDNAAVHKLECHMRVVVASLVLWMFRAEGAMKNKAWGRLQGVRPGQLKACFRASDDEGSRQDCDISC
jgi:hypothetical protein